MLREQISKGSTLGSLVSTKDLLKMVVGKLSSQLLDANKDNLFASSLSNSSFNRLLSTIKSQRMVIFMDACYSGGVAQSGSRDLGIIENPYERLAEGQGRLVISAQSRRSFPGKIRVLSTGFHLSFAGGAKRQGLRR